jgi:hypothetical protein
MSASRIGFLPFISVFSSETMSLAVLTGDLVHSSYRRKSKFASIDGISASGQFGTVRELTRLPPLKMGFESPRITPEQSRELP